MGAATAVNGGNGSQVTATATDAAGNVYLTGSFKNTVTFGSTTLTSANPGYGYTDVFVAKFDPVANRFIWAMRAGGTYNEEATALAVSGGSVYVAGSFDSYTAAFGATTLTNANTSPFRIKDVFVAKLVDAGSSASFAWAQQAGGSREDAATALAVSGNSVYVAGNFGSSTISFGTITLNNTLNDNVFVVKLTDAGSAIWAQRAGGHVNALAVSGANVYVAGYFISRVAADFGATILTPAFNPDSLNEDVFVGKLTDAGSTGSFTWAQRAGGSSRDFATALAVSGANVYVTGLIRDATCDFGPTTLSSAGGYDVFVAKLVDAGFSASFAWAQRAGSDQEDFATALAVSGSNVYIAGFFFGLTASLGPITLTNGGGATFVTKLTDAGSAGSFMWAQQTGAALNGLVLSGTSVYGAGYLSSATASFGSVSVSNPSPNTNMGFLASLTDATLTATSAGRGQPTASLFPNPARHTATLRLPVGTAPAPLTLTDAQGRTARCYPAPAASQATLDLRGLPAGLYLLRGAGPALRLEVE